MALQKARKEEMVKDLEGVIKGSESLVFVNFKGLNVADETKLRRELRDKGVNYKVSRKTLLRRALEGKAGGEIPELPGEIAIAYLPAGKAGSKDATASAREVFNFGKTHQGMLSIIGGIFEGKFIGKEKMLEIATIPSKEVLLSKLAFLFKSPMQRLAIAINAIAQVKSSKS